jgi:alpha/beta superfamily hydrolase
MGRRIVQTLLAASPPVRIIYKPHPLTGTRDQSVARAMARSLR